jgi:hypothetical protein
MRYPSDTLATLLEQHRELRVMIATCQNLIAALDAGEPVETSLVHAIARLRIRLEAHNVLEERLLRTLLLDADAFGPVRVDQMVHDHVEEHRATGEALISRSPSNADLQHVLSTLREHLDHEEQYFLSARVLRDDLVSVESSS